MEDVLEVTPQPRPLEELLAQATERRRKFRRTASNRNSTQAAIKVARAGYFPTFSSPQPTAGRASISHFRSAEQLVVGASMNFPLFNGLLTQYSVSQSKAHCGPPRKITRCCAKRHKEVNQAYLNVKSGWELIRATKKALEAARENLRLAWGRYQAGVSTIIEVTDAQGPVFPGDLNDRPVRCITTGSSRRSWTRLSGSVLSFGLSSFFNHR